MHALDILSPRIISTNESISRIVCYQTDRDTSSPSQLPPSINNSTSTS